MGADSYLGDDSRNKLKPRSAAQQARSRERLQDIIATAEAMVAESGIDGLRMRELARRSEVPIASLYHYFPSSASVLVALATKHLEGIRQLLSVELAGAIDPSLPIDLRPDTCATLIRNVAAYLFQEPLSATLWDCLRSRPDLRQLDVEDTAANAKLLEPYLRWVAPNLSDSRVQLLTSVMLEAMLGNLTVMLNCDEDTRDQHLDGIVTLYVATIRGLQTL